MEKNQLIKAAQGNNSLQNYSAITTEENRILSLHKEGIPFSKVESAKKAVVAAELMLSISVITGWKLPVNEALGMLIKQMTLKFEESFGSLTGPEIEYAFRHASVENWGASFNLKLVADVLIPFIHKRAEIRQQAANNRTLELPEVQKTPEERLKEAAESYIYWEKEIEAGVNIHYLPSSLWDNIEKVDKVCASPLGMENSLKKARSFLINNDAEQWNKIIAKNVNQSTDNLNDWTQLPEIQKYAKAFMAIDYFKQKQDTYIDLKFKFLDGKDHLQP